MSINLFNHNQTAYETANDMLDSVGKAAVIHPTSTGKSKHTNTRCQVQIKIL